MWFSFLLRKRNSSSVQSALIGVDIKLNMRLKALKIKRKLIIRILKTGENYRTYKKKFK